jgi:hypothetical protein
MQKYVISTPIAFAIACSVSFAAGYAFHLVFGFERKAAHQAIVEAQAFQRVMAAYSPIIANHSDYLELSKIAALDEVSALREKRKENTIRSAEFFISTATALELPEERRFAEPFLQEAAKVKASLEAKQ